MAARETGPAESVSRAEDQTQSEVLEDASVEDIDDALREVDELLQAWNDRLRYGNARLVQRHLKGKLRIHVHIRTVFKEYCAVYGPALVGLQGNPHPIESFWRDSDHRWNNRNVGIDRADGKQEAVFVANVELVNGPKRWCPTLVRLQPLYQSHRTHARALYRSSKGAFKTLGALTDREFDAASWYKGSWANESTGKMVEDGPEVMETIAKNASDLWWRLVEDLKPAASPSRIHVAIGNDEVWVGREVDRDCCFEIFEVLLGPFDLRPGAGEWIGHLQEE